MFSFTTQTVLNNVTVATQANIRNHTAVAGYNVITGSDSPEVRINNIRFVPENIKDIQKKVATPEHLAKAEIDFADVIEQVTGLNAQSDPDAVAKDTQDGLYRLVLYVGLSMTSQDSFYANSYVYKGKPFYIEFTVKADDTPTQIAARIVKQVNKFNLLKADIKILDVTASSGVLIIQAVDGYQLLKKVIVQKFDPDAIKIDCCSTTGDFVDVMVGVPVAYKLVNGVFTSQNKTMDEDTQELRALADNEFAIEPGLEAFGDYNWIMHNLRLPTGQNTYYWSPTKSEMPVPGGKYNQYIIRMCVDRLGIAGEVVGQQATSVTTHVFYVLDDGVAGATGSIGKFEAALAAIIPAAQNNALLATADNALNNPYHAS